MANHPSFIPDRADASNAVASRFAALAARSAPTATALCLAGAAALSVLLRPGWIYLLACLAIGSLGFALSRWALRRGSFALLTLAHIGISVAPDWLQRQMPTEHAWAGLAGLLVSWATLFGLWWMRGPGLGTPTRARLP